MPDIPADRRREMAAHYGPGGPVEPQMRWVDAVKAGKWDEAWKLMDMELRLVRAQGFLWNNRSHPLVSGQDLDALAAELCRDEPEHILWPGFAETELSLFAEAWADWDLSEWGVASNPRPVDLDYELVLWIRSDGEAVQYETDTFVPPQDAKYFLMHRTDDGWKVAAIGTSRHEPGWPPSTIDR